MASIDIFQPLSDLPLTALSQPETTESFRGESLGQGPIRATPIRVTVVAGEQSLGGIEFPFAIRPGSHQVIRAIDLCDAIAHQLGPQIAALWFGDAQPVTLLRQIWNRPDWSLEQFQDADFRETSLRAKLAAAVQDVAAKLHTGADPQSATDDPTLNVASGWLSLDLLSELPEHLTVWGDHLRIGLCWGSTPIGAISFGAPRQETFCITAQQIRAAFSQSHIAAMGRVLVRSLLGKRPSREQSWRSQLQGRGSLIPAARSVSVIIPAFNAEQYLPECLESILAQTYPHWELILVDDGSSDGTLAIASEFAQRDGRVKIVQQPNQGSGAARNNGVRLAQFDWLAFLDADDWWDAEFLESMMAAVDADLTLDAVRCSWNRVAADGTVIEIFEAHSRQSAFQTAVLECGFHPASCMVSRALFEAAGGFDPTIVVSQDWDVWPRLARTGARFGIVEAALSYYRTVPSSLSAKPMRLLNYSLASIECCYGPDPRLLNPDPHYASGLDSSAKTSVQFHFILWCAGLAIFRGEDPLPLLAKAPRHIEPPPTADSISDYLKSVIYRSGQSPIHWPTLWEQHLEAIRKFIASICQHLEVQSEPFTREIIQQLEYKLLRSSAIQMLPSQPALRLGKSLAKAVELTQPLSEDHFVANSLDQADSASLHQLVAPIFYDKKKLGHLLIPLEQGNLNKACFANSVAEEYYWPILQQYLSHAYAFKANVDDHDDNNLGWEKFLQSLFEQPDWSSAQFYEAERDSLPTAHLAAANHPVERYQLQYYLSASPSEQPIRIEISQPLPVLITSPEVTDETIEILVTIAGCCFGKVQIHHEQGKVATGKMRTAILEAAPLEFCRLVVREALLWQPAKGRTLKQRLRSRFMNNALPSSCVAQTTELNRY